jgi:hypothetical protein
VTILLALEQSAYLLALEALAEHLLVAVHLEPIQLLAL